MWLSSFAQPLYLVSVVFLGEFDPQFILTPWGPYKWFCLLSELCFGAVFKTEDVCYAMAVSLKNPQKILRPRGCRKHVI